MAKMNPKEICLEKGVGLLLTAAKTVCFHLKKVHIPGSSQRLIGGNF